MAISLFSHAEEANAKTQADAKANGAKGHDAGGDRTPAHLSQITGG
jgi:hypothetical protein